MAFARHLTGLSPLQYQKIHRLSYAQTLLNDPHKSITWIAQEIGYESVSQFSREYKRAFGVSPSTKTAK
ncbi:helix-turn-helix transcriptional regulator [Mannheimia glucosida]|uniref:helix-turn-helix transcriptional regulator n=1 Tax=Mannheimia glucosida TaxID=85401 RepID=UPI003917FCAF